MSDEILTVSRLNGTPGDRWLKCPHCAETVNLPSGLVRGEQFQHRILRLDGPDRGCLGWFEVAHDAKLENAE